ncbi:MAG: ABC transporter substrate-binding protein [Paenibacillus sp.]|uniref:ABC transporter substrate-binding protein n=1 Tax=Paenibacillus sp. TaxID=58172 RepID=UPI002906B184|nr:ABC transporter substrate-binding protein [Paenibacillus sp.]MDU4698192.1 ABC transporter substrate-binding protein [Paenibacillus sp.]
MKRGKWLAVLPVAAMMISLLGAYGVINAANNEESQVPGLTEGSPGSPVVLTFWTLGSTPYEALAQEYMAEHPYIRIQFSNMEDPITHHDRLESAISSGSGAPDIFMLDREFMERFIASSNPFYNLYDFGAKDIEMNYLYWAWKQATLADGSFQLGLPAGIQPTVVYYRTDVMERAGLPTDPEEFSAAINKWDKFAAVAKRFTEETGIPFADSADLVYNGLRDQSTDRIYFNKVDGTFIGDTNPQVRKAFDFTVKGIQEGWIGRWTLGSSEWEKAIRAGEVGVILGPTWMEDTIRSAKETAGKWRIAQIPEGSGSWGGSFLTLPKEGKHPKEAYEFITWLTNKENQLESYQAGRLLPSIPAVYNEPAFQTEKDDFFGGQVVSEAYARSAQRVKPVYHGPQFEQVDTEIKNALRHVLENKANPQQAWDDAMDIARNAE